ncbi:MAG TPA: hypothetical protein PLM49_03015, partial [Bacteroidales bacterium]|nr:hypothetical protein [Bacteroidales bacterium]
MDTDNKPQRLAKIATELNVGTSSIIEFLAKKGHKIDTNPNTKIPAELLPLLRKEFSDSVSLKEQSLDISARSKEKKVAPTETVSEAPRFEEEKIEEKEFLIKDSSGFTGPKIVGKIDLPDPSKKKKTEEVQPKEMQPEEAKTTGASVVEPTQEEPVAQAEKSLEEPPK